MRFRARELRDALGMVPDECSVEIDQHGRIDVYNAAHELVDVIEVADLPYASILGADAAKYRQAQASVGTAREAQDRMERMKRAMRIRRR